MLSQIAFPAQPRSRARNAMLRDIITLVAKDLATELARFALATRHLASTTLAAPVPIKEESVSAYFVPLDNIALAAASTGELA